MGRGLSTRTEPPLALARLRAHDELAEFRERDLRFDLDEVRALLPQLPGARRPAATSRRLLERTQGWAVGLRLAVNSLAASPADAAPTAARPASPTAAATARLRLPARRGARRDAGRAALPSCCAARC
jgi:ATP/maltotriose-dependent transcriptional regulator MalT